MEYNIASLAKQARVTVRTLRHYDQIGLLKPLIRMESGKRVYGEAEYWRLFEILFFKKMGLSLPKIQEILDSKNSNKAAATVLEIRKGQIAKEIRRLQRYQASIEMAIPYYKNNILKPKERLEQLQSLQNTMKEVEKIQVQELGKEKVEEGKAREENLSEEQVEERVDRSNRLMKEAVAAVEQGKSPQAKDVQAMMKRYYDLLAEFNPVNREAFLKLKESVLEHKELYARYHPKMANFLYEAMGVFAEEFFH